MAVERVHARVGDRDVDVTCSLTDESEESVGGRYFKVGNGHVFVVHFNHRNGVVLACPSEVVSPTAKGVVGVADGDVRCRV